MIPEEISRKTDQEPVAQASGVVPSPKSPKPLAKISRELTDSDLANPGVQKLVLGEIDRLESEVSRLQGTEEKLHVAELQNCALKEQGKLRLSSEIIFGICVSAGSGLMSFSYNLWKDSYFGVSLLIIGAVLIITGIVSRIVTK